MTLEAGDVAIVEPGQAHKFWNAGDEPVRFVCEVRPALQFESLLETMFALAADGKTNKKGMPNPLRLAVIAKAHFDTVRLPFPPAWMQAAGLAVGAPLGKLLGYEATYEGKDEQVPGGSRRRVAQDGSTRDRPRPGGLSLSLRVQPSGVSGRSLDPPAHQPLPGRPA